MTRYRKMNPSNLHEIPNGTEVRFDYGPMHGSDRGWVIGREVTRWGAHLLAMTDDGKLKMIDGISTVGVGVHTADAAVGVQFVSGGQANA